MRVYVNGNWCDTKLDWGYETDEKYIIHIIAENMYLKEENRNLRLQVTELLKKGIKAE